MHLLTHAAPIVTVLHEDLQVVCEFDVEMKGPFGMLWICLAQFSNMGDNLGQNSAIILGQVLLNGAAPFTLVTHQCRECGAPRSGPC
jgi:hypothetical protein